MAFLQLLAAYALPFVPAVLSSISDYAAAHPSPWLTVLTSVLGVGLAHLAPSPVKK